MRLMLLAAAVLGVAGLARAESLATTPVVLELFTSEGCSSCPPADRLLADLVAHPPEGVTIVALEQHVDYWDNLGWTDPFASHAATARQYAYADAFRSSQVYTPQLVVDGQAEMVGSDRGRVLEAIKAAAARAKAVLGIAVERKERELRVTVSVPAKLMGDLVVVVTEDGLTVTPSRGENAAARLAHQAVVRSQQVVKTLDGGDKMDVPVTLTLGDGVNAAKCHVAAFVQQGNKAIGAAGIVAVK